MSLGYTLQETQSSSRGTTYSKGLMRLYHCIIQIGYNGRISKGLLFSGRKSIAGKANQRKEYMILSKIGRKIARTMEALEDPRLFDLWRQGIRKIEDI